MGIFKDLFGQKKQIEKKDYFDYDKIPKEIRQKIYFVISENAYHYEPSGWSYYPKKIEEFNQLRYQISKHKGLSNINNEVRDSNSIHNWIMECDTTDFLQTIDIFLRMRAMDKTHNGHVRFFTTVEDFNDIFEIDKIGYEIINGKIIRTDTKYLHKEVIKESLFLLRDKKFENALDEFENALDKYFNKEYKESITYANASFESTMKIILKKKKSDASQLIAELLKFEKNGKKLIPSYYSSFLENFKKILKIVPITRNEMAKGLPHGSGSEKVIVDKSFAELTLHMTGSIIVFLMKLPHL